MWRSLGYFNTVIEVKLSCANSAYRANFRTFFVHVIYFRPTDLSLIKRFSKKKVLMIFIILFEGNCPGQWSMNYHMKKRPPNNLCHNHNWPFKAANWNGVSRGTYIYQNITFFLDFFTTWYLSNLSNSLISIFLN